MTAVDQLEGMQATEGWTHEQQHPTGATSLNTDTVVRRPMPSRSPTATTLMMSSTSAHSGKRLGREPTMTGRPGWEGEEMVNVLREDGMEGELTLTGGAGAWKAYLPS